MDGIHDLGGMEGFGPIDTGSPPFSHDWEARQWALTKHSDVSSGTLDWWRHTIERMQPATYLSIPYFEKWCLNELVQLLMAGDITMEQALSGSAPRIQEPRAPSGVDGALKRLQANEVFFDCDPGADPRFAVGETVRTLQVVHANHTRLPRYARGRIGTITAHHGGHIFPDSSAEGREEGQHLYTVAFTAGELWGDTEHPGDRVRIDLWESYLVRA